MSIRINNQSVNGAKLGGHRIIEGKLNGQVLFRFEGTPYMSYKIKINSDLNYTIPFTTGEYGDNLTNITILWGDDSSTVITNGSITNNNCTHTYASSGEYDVFIYSYNNKIPKISFEEGNLRSIPNLLRINNPILPMINFDGTKITTGMFNSMFESCLKLMYVSENIFDLNNTETDFSECFYQCVMLENIPENIFSECLQAVNLNSCFKQCSNITSIPKNLFKNNINITSLSSCFENTTSLEEVPSGLFDSLINLRDVSYLFKNSEISTVPEGLFDRNILIENMTGLFSYNMNISSVPEELFKYNINVTNFSECFLETFLSHAENLFKYNINALDFSRCFKNCDYLLLSNDMFCDEDIEMDTRFAGKNIDFTECFSRDSYYLIDVKGMAPKLWNYTYNSVIKTNCFSGNGNKGESIFNYYIIPEIWGGPYKENSMTFIIDTTKLSPTNKTFVLPFYTHYYPEIGEITIYWGDGSSTFIARASVTDDKKTHTYANAGEYAITITSSRGNIPEFGFHFAGENDSQIQITRFETPLLHMYEGFMGDYEVKEITCFDNCSNLEYVYEDLLINNTQATSIGALFRNCINLTEIPENIFKPMVNLTSFNNTFSNSGITYIDEDLFRYNTNIGGENEWGYNEGGFEGVFSGCESLTYISENLFKYNVNALTFSFCFDGCSNLYSIPSDLFLYNTEVTDFSYCFQGCSNLNYVPYYLFRYNLKANNFDGLFLGCSMLELNKNIFCDEETEMNTRFASGDIVVYYTPVQNNLSFYKAFSYVGKGEAPQLWNYDYVINVDSGDEVKVLDYPYSEECFTLSQGEDFTNNIVNYSLIPQMWGGLYVPDSMTFIIDTTKLSSSNKKFIMPFVEGNYANLDNLTIDWGDTTYDERNIVVGDNLSNTEMALSFPDNLSNYLSSYPSGNFISCNEDLNFYTNYFSYDSYWEASVYVKTPSGRALIITPERGWIYSNSSENIGPAKYDLSEIGYCKGGLIVTSIDASNPAYQYVKLKIPNNQTHINDGIVTEELCTHNYDNPGVYTITITSSNGKIPELKQSLYYGSKLITSIKDTILEMVNTRGDSSTNMSGIFMNSSINKVPTGFFYFNRDIENASSLFKQTPLTSIPYDFFYYTINMKDISDIFSNCTELISIPQRLFHDLNYLEIVHGCFNNCTSLTSIPDSLFAMNENIVDFHNCFTNCISLNSIGNSLFCFDGFDSDIKFSNKIVNFKECFKNCICSTETTLPDLWNYNYYLVNSSDCFKDFGGNLSNWSDVPVGWGGDNIYLELNIDTTKGGQDDSSFIVPFVLGEYYSFGRAITIDWGDGSSTIINQVITEELCTHNYDVPGIYTIIIKDSSNEYMPRLCFGEYNDTNASKLLNVKGTLYKLANKDDDIVYDEFDNIIDVANFDYMFSGCSNLTKVDSSLLMLNNGDSLNNIYPSAVRMFENSGIIALQEDFFSKSYCRDYNACFYDCKSLVLAPNLLNADNYNSCFYGCLLLKDISPNLFQWRGQNSGVNKKFNFCFSDCISLVSIPNGLFAFIDEEGLDEFAGCFKGCINLTTIPDNLFTSANSISFAMCFEDCKKLQIKNDIFGNNYIKFGSLGDDETVDMSSMFSIVNYIGVKGTAPDLWNYLYSPSNYVNLFTQNESSSSTKTGVTAVFNSDSSISINGTPSEQNNFYSNDFSLALNSSKFYNICLESVSGSATIASTALVRMQILNSTTNEVYYSKNFSSLNDLSKWKGISFNQSMSTNCKLAIRVYVGNSYDNLVIKPKISEAKINYSECFKGHSTNTLTNYNDIPDSWK